ncbi:MAG: hydroxymethylbilane synthase [Bradymonadia bacterium]
MSLIRIGTRGSQLALWQANHIADRLRAVREGTEVELVVIKTTGDKITDRPLALVGGKGLFVKEIEEALLADGVDLAVHSLKDMPTEQPEGLELSCYPGRAEPFDALCAREPIRSVADLPQNARIGTGSLRRQVQLQAVRPDLEMVGIRGNVPTRLKKRFEAENVDAVVLAAAGLRRLGLWEDGFLELTPPDVLPAPAQGILALETRLGDARLKPYLSALDDFDARLAALAERGALRAIGGDCHTPFAAFATRDGDYMTVTARLYAEDGKMQEARQSGPVEDGAAADELGTEVGAMLVE